MQILLENMKGSLKKAANLYLEYTSHAESIFLDNIDECDMHCAH